MVYIITALAVGLLAAIANAFNYDQPYRDQYHFSPQKGWMNDPSGLLYHNGIYHLFFQYNPGGIQWGNMSWGHATSKDLTHWEEPRGPPRPGIWRGFGKDGKTPIVAMYTSYYPFAKTLPSGKTSQENQQAQSIAYSLDDDWGPDFYTAASYNGLPIDANVYIAWMNNWQYTTNVPTDPWHSATAIPRHLALKTIRDMEGSIPMRTTGETIKIDLSFSAASKSSKFAIAVRGSADFTEQTLVGYDFVNKQVFIDRTKSGDVSFDNTFSSVYRGPLAAGVDGNVSLSIFVDRSSVEVFGGQGETTLTAQIFPSRDAVNAKLVSTGGATKGVKLDIFNIASTWN
ncbi:exoinulinase [Penicillium cf. viridicatum]|uniref:Exoinulinase n=1 Tax=Penicillium cf. viridicatum TaxID=2972119 RepID=A0A9W9SZ96_9EURO|nr:exoinulinase [Penicillium cf. viridicatum]